MAYQSFLSRNPQLLALLLAQKQQAPQQQAQGQQGQQPGVATLIKGVQNGSLGNVVNSIGSNLGYDWSTLAGRLGGGTEIGGSASANLPSSIAELFGGASAGASGAGSVGATTTTGWNALGSSLPEATQAGALPTATPTMGIGTLPALGMGVGVVGGLALGAKGLKDLLNDKKTKGLEGWGGRATLGIATGGLSEVARGLGLFNQGRDYRKESLDRVQALKDKGIKTHDFGDMSGWGVKNENTSSIDEVIKSGNVKAEDIWGNPAFYEKYGNDWLGKFSEEERRAKSQEAINAGALMNKDHQLDIDFKKIDEFLKQQGVA